MVFETEFDFSLPTLTNLTWGENMICYLIYRKKVKGWFLVWFKDMISNCQSFSALLNDH